MAKPVPVQVFRPAAFFIDIGYIVFHDQPLAGKIGKAHAFNESGKSKADPDASGGGGPNADRRTYTEIPAPKFTMTGARNFGVIS